MKIILFIIIALVLLLFFIDIDIEGTYWIEKETGRPIIILHFNKDEGLIVFQYAGDPFERQMSIFELVTKYKYNGE